MTFSVKKIIGSYTRRNFEDNDLIFLNSQIRTCLLVKLKKNGRKPPLPPKTAIFCRKLTFSGHIRRIFNDYNPIFSLNFRVFRVGTFNSKNLQTKLDHYHKNASNMA